MFLSFAPKIRRLFYSIPIPPPAPGGIGGVFDLFEAIKSSTLNIMHTASVADNNLFLNNNWL
jgi:xanthine/uracil permease